MRKDAASTYHLMRHSGHKNIYCRTWRDVNVIQMPARKRDPEKEETYKAEDFGDLILTDHITIKKEKERGQDGEMNGLGIYDKATDYYDFFSVEDKSAEQAELRMKEFAGNDDLHWIFSDNSWELKKLAEDFDAHHPTSTPYRAQNNAKIENMNDDCNIGIRANLYQSGLPHSWWPDAGRHYSVARNTDQSVGKGELSPWEMRHHETFWGYHIPFGAYIRYRPTKPNREKLSRYEPRSVAGLFVNWFIQPEVSFLAITECRHWRTSRNIREDR